MIGIETNDIEISGVNVEYEMSAVSDYSKLTNKPKINGVELDGNKTTEDLHIEPGTPCFYAEDTETSTAIYQEYIDDESLVNGKFVVLMTASGFYNGTDNEKPGIYAISYHSYEALSVTASDVTSLLSEYGTTILSRVAAIYYNKNETDALIAALGSVFTFKGTKQTTLDLPSRGNIIGDVWYVVSKSLEYVWIDDGTARWEPLGEIVDLSNYYTKSEVDSLLANNSVEVVRLI